ncbi:MAG TPA: hypothetical protein VGH20_05000 [Myxococcales bacterium]|jgi:hypothetical protein
MRVLLPRKASAAQGLPVGIHLVFESEIIAKQDLVNGLGPLPVDSAGARRIEPADEDIHMTRSLSLLILFLATPAFAQTSESPALPPAAKAAYDSKYVTVGDAVTVTVDADTTIVTNTYNLYQGQYRAPLDEDAFFDLAGRPDLATWYRNRQHLKEGLVVGGLAVAVGGLVALATTGCDVPLGSPSFGDQCVNGQRYIVPAAVFAGGGLLALAGGMLNSHPLAAPQMRQLADQYNQGLLQSLSSPEAPRESSNNLGATPFVANDGGGLLVSGTF